jgi:uncharacterized membrane protein YbhN (UPF0104 family)
MLTRRQVLFVAKSLFAMLVLAAITLHFYRLLDSPDWSTHEVHIAPLPLLGAGLLYLAAHTIWGSFFYLLLRHEGAHVSWGVALRTYFISQVGKYVPGKAWVILIRIGLLKRYSVNSAVVAVSGTYETLTTMAAGALLGVCLFPWLGLTQLGEDSESALKFSTGSWEWLVLLAVAGMPLALGVMNRFLMKRIQKKRGPDAVPLPSPSLRLLLQGFVQALVGWCLLGMSLWLTVRAITEVPFTAEVFAESVAAVAVAYVAGFVAVLIPGGLGVRELILQRVLVKQLTSAVAVSVAPLSVLIAILLRLVWTAFEVLLAGFCAWQARSARLQEPSNTT